jgi:hypothetical protein
MNRRSGLYAVLWMMAALSAFAALKQQAKKAPWEFTLDERLTLRNDAVAASERVSRARANSSAPTSVRAASQATAAAEPVDIIWGGAHPELFHPWELFDDMMNTAFADDPHVRSTYREATAKLAEASGLPQDFWRQLELISGPYLSDWRQNRDLHRKLLPPGAERSKVRTLAASLETLKCRDRATAIAAARAAFGQSFDKFLYTAVAPGMSSSIYVRMSDQRARSIEGGCQ